MDEYFYITYMHVIPQWDGIARSNYPTNTAVKSSFVFYILYINKV